MQFRFLFVMMIILIAQSCSNDRNIEYTNEFPPSESVQANHSSANVKDPVFEQKN
jgi:hypothetical protein